MSYLVLARKWRPQRFDDMVGQEHVTRTLANAIRQDRVAHAFLFTGSRGVGKTTTARILAKALNCEHGPTPEPCNSCPQCGEITEGRAVDVIEIDGASNRGINEIREVREAVRYAPSRSRYKVYILDEVHMLTTEAFNALLKTLEEPPSHAVFVFATTEPNKIPVTILSRCQRYDFKRVQVRDIVARLDHIARAEQLGFDEAALALIARHARGGMRDALSSMDQVIAFASAGDEGAISAEVAAGILGVASRRHLLALGEALVRGDIDTALNVLDHVDGYGHDLAHFAVELLHHLRDMTVVRAVTDARAITELSDSEHAAVAGQVAGVPVAQLQRMFQVCADAVEQISRSQFPRLLLEMTLVKLASVEPLVPLDALIGKLSALEQALAGDGELADDVLERYRGLLAELSPPAPSQPAAVPMQSPPPPPPRPVQSAASGDGASPGSVSQASVSVSPAARGQAREPAARASSSSSSSGDDDADDSESEGPPSAFDVPVAAAARAVVQPQVSVAAAPVAAAPVAVALAAQPDGCAPDEDTTAAMPDASAAATDAVAVQPVDQGLWQVILDGLTPKQANVLSHAVLTRLEAEVLEFWLPQSYRAFLAAADVEALAEAAAEALRANPRVRMLEGEEAPQTGQRTLAEQRHQAHRAALVEQRRQIQEDPLLIAAMQQFSVPPEKVSINLHTPDEEHGR